MFDPTIPGLFDRIYLREDMTDEGEKVTSSATYFNQMDIIMLTKIWRDNEILEKIVLSRSEIDAFKSWFEKNDI